jgi:hypothetical protein
MTTDSNEPQLSNYPQLDVHYRAAKRIWSTPRVIEADSSNTHAVRATRVDTIDVVTTFGRFGRIS